MRVRVLRRCKGEPKMVKLFVQTLLLMTALKASPALSGDGTLPFDEARYANYDPYLADPAELGDVEEDLVLLELDALGAQVKSGAFDRCPVGYGLTPIRGFISENGRISNIYGICARQTERGRYEMVYLVSGSSCEYRGVVRALGETMILIKTCGRQVTTLELAEVSF